MALHPEIQRKAQQEIDRVVGSDRLPVHADASSLPYVQALLLEIERWRPPVPMGIPHCAMTDDEYKGYHIAKGTIVVPVSSFNSGYRWKMFIVTAFHRMSGNFSRELFSPK